MLNRRETIGRSAAVASLLAATGLFPQSAQAWNQNAFGGKTVQEAIKALGPTGALVESKDVVLTAPDIAENGAVVPLGVASNLPGI